MPPRTNLQKPSVIIGGHRITEYYSADEIARRVETLAGEIAASHNALGLNQPLIVVALLKGAMMFTADLCRALYRAGIVLEVDFMHISSYGAGTVSSGTPTLISDIRHDVAGSHVLLVDDILESGRTVHVARSLLMERGAAHCSTCVFLEKPGKRALEISAEHVGFLVPDHFVVGYGLDYANRYRELPFIGTVEEI